jgi:hypothetical protein
VILRLAETVPWAGGYSSSAHTAWQPGEVREVDEAEAARLLATFPDLFAPVAVAPPPEPEPPPIAPPKPSRRR